ncbi:MAG: hypothetical protein OXF24_03410, partial [Hyphomicrobiales bacterium]|nr:hypothetical protein [Hyphomicrobiales bacterium]
SAVRPGAAGRFFTGAGRGFAGFATGCRFIAGCRFAAGRVLPPGAVLPPGGFAKGAAPGVREAGCSPAASPGDFPDFFQKRP